MLYLTVKNDSKIEPSAFKKNVFYHHNLFRLTKYSEINKEKQVNLEFISLSELNSQRFTLSLLDVPLLPRAKKLLPANCNVLQFG